MRIYILGPVGSGKSTLAKKFSCALNIKYYELDSIVWKKTITGDVKRTSADRDKLFKKIIERKNWIIEDVGRSCFKGALAQADIIIYINLKRHVLYWRIFERWIRQKFKIEPAPYKCNFRMLVQMYNWANNDIKNKKLDKLLVYKDKLLVLNSKEIKKFENSTYIVDFFKFM